MAQNTPSGHAGLSSEAWQHLEAILEDFENAWQRGERPCLDYFLARAQGEAQRRALLIELVHEDLELRRNDEAAGAYEPESPASRT